MIVEELGFDKLALYILNGKPTHAARIIYDGIWTSKFGSDIDLSHSLAELNGPSYGSAARFFKKAIA
ncbi:MAG: DUF7689 domain-containing protein [Methylocella sp.]